MRQETEATRRYRGILIAVVLLITIGTCIIWVTRVSATELVLTGIVTTDDVIVSPQVAGRLDRVTVKEGDAVTRGQVLAVLSTGELAAERAFFAHSADDIAGQIEESEATLHYEERQSEQQIRAAAATLAAVDAEYAEATANLAEAKVNLERAQLLAGRGAGTEQDLERARTRLAVAQARELVVHKRIDAERAELALARATAEQVVARRKALAAIKQRGAAAAAQIQKADVRLSYADITAPIDGIVSTRAARQGEVVGAGQPVLALVDPDDLWVRVDIEETYISWVRIGDRMRIRLQSGEEREGIVFYRGVDAGFATQRDVSRTKRDIKTFEIRLRVDNRDRRLAVGMTAYVLFRRQA